MAKFYILYQMNKRVDGVDPKTGEPNVVKTPVLTDGRIFTAQELKQYVAANGMAKDTKVALVQEVDVTVTKVTETVERDKLDIGEIAP